MELNQERIEAGIIAEVAAKMLGDDDLWDRVKKTIDAKIDRAWAEVVQQRIVEAVNAAVADGFERTYQKVDNFGTKIGEPTTIKGELHRLIEGYWTQKVDRDGKPSTGYGALPRAEWMMTKLVADDFSGNMKQHIVNIGGALKDSLRAELHGTVNSLLSEVFRVKSAGDAGAKNPGRATIDPPVKPVT